MKYKKYLIDNSLKKTKHASIRLKNLQTKKFVEDSMKNYISISSQNQNSSNAALKIPSIDLISNNQILIESSNILNSNNSNEETLEDVTFEIINQSSEPLFDSESGDGDDFNLLLSGLSSVEERAAAMLAYFFGANLTQKGLKILSEFMESFMPNEDLKLPKTFDQIANLLLKKMDSKIKFDKISFLLL